MMKNLETQINPLYEEMSDDELIQERNDAYDNGMYSDFKNKGITRIIRQCTLVLRSRGYILEPVGNAIMQVVPLTNSMLNQLS